MSFTMLHSHGPKPKPNEPRPLDPGYDRMMVSMAGDDGQQPKDPGKKRMTASTFGDDNGGDRPKDPGHKKRCRFAHSNGGDPNGNERPKSDERRRRRSGMRNGGDQPKDPGNNRLDLLVNSALTACYTSSVLRANRKAHRVQKRSQRGPEERGKDGET